LKKIGSLGGLQFGSADHHYGKIMRCALFEILYLTEVYLVTD